MASFAYLKSLPVDYIKIDGSFVGSIVSNAVDAEMVKSINQIGHLMGIEIVAEGVESEAVLEKLKQFGVDFAQGYWIGKPKRLE